MTAKRNVMREFRIDEISGVDVPAQEGAVVAIMKRAPEGAADVAKCTALTTETAGHTHLVSMDGQDPSSGNWPKASGYTTYDAGHIHPWVMDEAGQITIGAAAGHTHGIASIGKKAEAKESDEMTTTPEAALEANKALETQLAKANAMASMNDAQKAYHAAQDEAGKASFEKLSVEDRQAAVDKAKADATSANPVIYKGKDGVEYRKSDGAVAVALAKRLDEQGEQIAKQSADLEKAAYLKRVETELSHTPGTVDERVAMLKAVDSIPDASARDAALKGLKAGNDALKKNFKVIGTQEGGEGGGDVKKEVEDKLEAMAKKYQADNAGTSYAKAYDAVLKTPEGKAAYQNLPVKTVNS